MPVPILDHIPTHPVRRFCATYIPCHRCLSIPVLLMSGNHVPTVLPGAHANYIMPAHIGRPPHPPPAVPSRSYKSLTAPEQTQQSVRRQASVVPKPTNRQTKQSDPNKADPTLFPSHSALPACSDMPTTMIVRSRSGEFRSATQHTSGSGS